jgi:ABC-2 type transport system permease protein
MIFGGVMIASTVSTLLPLAGTDLKSLPITAEQAALLKIQIDRLVDSPWMAFVPLLERLLAIITQVVLSLIVWQAFLRRNLLQRAGFILLAILYHMAIDTGAVYLVQQVSNPWLLEGAFALALLPGAAWLVWLIRRQPIPPRPVTSLAREWGAFVAALRKELLQQWRTRRVLVVLAVFGLFGMASPLLAYFMPQLFTVIPGAEQFAGLIPEPTIADALGQYIKNITQFGFLLAVLLGMGVVVGEKERGTAALILSKPMSRWAFILSKFTAQTILYLLGFLLAMLGAGFYTYYLFDGLDFAGLGLITLLLVLWLLPFTAVALLGSVVGGTTSAAAGISLIGAVTLMLAGNLPVVGYFLPGALSTWAGQLGAGNPPQAWNGGALAASVVLCLVCIIFGIAIFERQEL